MSDVIQAISEIRNYVSDLQKNLDNSLKSNSLLDKKITLLNNEKQELEEIVKQLKEQAPPTPHAVRIALFDMIMSEVVFM